MNIFEDRTGILGARESAHVKKSLQGVIQLAADIREKLGNQGYLIELYLSNVLEAISNTSGYDAVIIGFDTAAQLRRLCFDVMDGTGEHTDHPFYPIVKKCFADHPSNHQERYTVMNQYYALLAEEFLIYAISQFLHDEEEKLCLVMDEIEQRQLYGKISAVVGEPLLSQLNLAIKEKFLTITVSMGFAHGLSRDLLDCLIYEDKETGKRLFQIQMDEFEKGT